MSGSFLPIEGLMEKGGSDIEASSSSWDELPVDLLEKVMRRISLSDQVRFGAVCKNMWAIDILLSSNSLPWIISIENFLSMYRLYELSSSYPSCQLRTTFTPKNLNIFHIFQKYDWFSIDTVCVNGWIFYSQQIPKRANFLLFSPYTKQVIKLPSIFNWPKNDSKFIRSFSGDPNSSDCVFFILHHSANVRRITIKTWKHGDKNWTSREFDKSNNFDQCQRIPVYIGESFYFLIPRADMASYNIASYNIARGEWKVQNVLFEGLDTKYKVYNSINKAFELNGDLMLIHFMKPFGFITKFDWSTNVWVPLKSLGDHALFVDENSRFAKKVDQEARNNGVFPNKIYYLSYSCYLYSFEDGKLTIIATYWDKVTISSNGLWFEPPHHIVKEKTWGESEDELIETDEQFKNLKFLDQMRRSRNYPTYNDTGDKHRKKK